MTRDVASLLAALSSLRRTRRLGRLFVSPLLICVVACSSSNSSSIITDGGLDRGGMGGGAGAASGSSIGGRSAGVGGAASGGLQGGGEGGPGGIGRAGGRGGAGGIPGPDGGAAARGGQGGSHGGGGAGGNIPDTVTFVCGGGGTDAGTMVGSYTCVGGQTFCKIEIQHSGSGVVSEGCQSFTDAARGVDCSGTPNCACLCTDALFFHCQTECRCSETEGHVTVTCQAI